MPELPEITALAERIAAAVAGRPFAGAVPLSFSGLKTVVPGPETLVGTLQVSANAAEVGDNLSDVDASVEGPSGVIAFNVKYLLDVLTNTKSQQYGCFA